MKNPNSSAGPEKAQPDTVNRGYSLRAKYVRYPETATDDEIFAGDPDLVDQMNLARLVSTYSLSEIARRIGVRRETVADRFNRHAKRIAAAHGKTVIQVKDELRGTGKKISKPRSPRREQESHESSEDRSSVEEPNDGEDQPSTEEPNNEDVQPIMQEEDAADLPLVLPQASGAERVQYSEEEIEAANILLAMSRGEQRARSSSSQRTELIKDEIQ